MREYLFRGKRIDTNEWVYGHYYPLVGSAELRLSKNEYTTRELNRHYILVSTLPNMLGWDAKSTFIMHKVIPETIGQYTGLCAIGKIKIFEGDIVKWGHIKGGEEDPIRIAEVNIDPDILFDSKNCNHVFRYGNFIYTSTDKYLSIIGNIHDNPELSPATT